MAALTEHYRARCTEETTADLRTALLSEMKQTMFLSTSTQDKLSEDVGGIRSILSNLQGQLDELKVRLKQEKDELRDRAKHNLSKYIIEDEVEQGRVKQESSRFH
jgi:hypothetical protein